MSPHSTSLTSRFSFTRSTRRYRLSDYPVFVRNQGNDETPVSSLPAEANTDGLPSRAEDDVGDCRSATQAAPLLSGDGPNSNDVTEGTGPWRARKGRAHCSR